MTHWDHSITTCLHFVCIGEVFNVLSVCGDFIYASVIMWSQSSHASAPYSLWIKKCGQTFHFVSSWPTV